MLRKRTEFKLGMITLESQTLLLLVASFYVFLFPTSIGGHIVDNMYIVRNGLGAIIVVLIVARNGILKNPLYMFLFLISWLSLLTLTTSLFYKPNDFRVAFASISGFLPTVLIWCVSIKNRTVSKRFAMFFLEAISILLCIWGWGLVVKNGAIISFTRAFYSQLNDTMFDSMVILRGKPVMSFGTHSMAAFFIMYVYYYHCVVIKEKQATPLNYIIMALLFLLEIPLRSNTAILAMAVMLFLLIWAKDSSITRTITIIAIITGSIYFYHNGFVTEFVGKIVGGPNSELHGVAARYLSGIYKGNVQMTTQYIGVGFLRSASNFFRMNDSGVIYLFTQGNIPAVIITYTLMYWFFKENMTKYAKFSFALFMIWELISATTFISVKMIFAHIMTIYLINSIVEKEEENNEARDIV